MKLGFNKDEKWRIRFFKKNCYVQNGENGAFLGQKSTFFNFSQNLFISFFWN